MILLVEHLLHKHEVLTLEIQDLKKDPVMLEPACDPKAREAETGEHLNLSGQLVYLNQGTRGSLIHCLNNESE